MTISTKYTNNIQRGYHAGVVKNAISSRLYVQLVKYLISMKNII